MPRVVVLGVGTAVGKTWVCTALLRELTATGSLPLGLKPVESGVSPTNRTATDAYALSQASNPPGELQALYALELGVSPHLAARHAGTGIALSNISAWIAEQEALHVVSHSAVVEQWTVIETAGGVFSPLGLSVTNFDLAQSLEPALWVLVAADSLGVLHDLTATLEAMAARGRTPDFVVLSQARDADASTGKNGSELALLGIATPVATLGRNDERSITSLAQALRRAPRSYPGVPPR